MARKILFFLHSRTAAYLRPKVNEVQGERNAKKVVSFSDKIDLILTNNC